MTTLTKEQFEELCSAYALGVLPAEERELFDEALRNGGEEYSVILKESLRVIDELNTDLPQTVPSPNVKKRLFHIIGTKQRMLVRRDLIERFALLLGFGNPRFGFSMAMLLLIAAGVGGIYSYKLSIRSEEQRNQISSYQTEITSQQVRFTALQTELQRKEAILNVLQSPKIEMVMMSGLEVNPSGYGKIIWDPARKVAILQVSKLPSVTSDNDYQLWYLDKDKKPVSAGLFAVANGEENYFSVQNVPLPDSVKDITAFAVTIEPKGGVPQPTGAMYLLGTPAVN